MSIVICSILGLVTLATSVILHLKWAFWLTDHLFDNPEDYCVRDRRLPVISLVRFLFVPMPLLLAAIFIGGPTGGLIVAGCEAAGALIGRLLLRVATRYHKDIYGDDEKNDRH